MATLESIEGKVNEVLELLKKKGEESLAGAFSSPSVAPVPEPIPEGQIIYPADGAKVIARIPMYFVYEGDGSPSWISSRSGDLKAKGGQVSLILPELGEQNIYAVVGKTVVDQITVIAEEPGPR